MNTKKWVSFAIVFFGLLTAFFIVFSTKDAAQPSQKQPVDAQPSVDPSFSFVRTPTSQTFPSVSAPSTPQTGTPLSNNFTDIFASLYVQKITQRNPAGLELVKGEPSLALPSTQDIGQILQEQTNLFFFPTPFTEKNILVSIRNTTEAQVTYLNALHAISKKYFDSFPHSTAYMLDRWIQAQDNTLLQDYVNRAQKQRQDLLALPVPPAWKAFHIQNLNLWTKKITIYSALIHANDDPLKAQLALEELPNIIEENSLLDNVIENRVQELLNG